MLEAVLQESRRQNVTVPDPYSFHVRQTTLIVEMKGPVNVWVVQVFPKDDTNTIVIQAEVDPTNFEVIDFTHLGRKQFWQQLNSK